MGMVEKEEGITTLINLGLTKTQARVYLALVERDVLPLRLAAKYSGVDRSETYRVMSELNHRGLIETILSSPTTYKPFPLSDAVTLLMEQKQRKILLLEEKTKKLLEEYKKKPNSQSSIDQREFVLLPKETSGTRKAKSAIKDARSAIDCIISVKRFNQLLLIASEDLIKAANRGIKIRFILDEKDLNKSLSKIFATFNYNASFKYIDELPPSFIAIYDKQSVLMETTEKDFGKSTMLWSSNIVIAKNLQKYFNLLWASNQANNVKQVNNALKMDLPEKADCKKLI
jgi:sugar-specific transcriptional regulator TrmB